jgi:hypothetical protein
MRLRPSQSSLVMHSHTKTEPAVRTDVGCRSSVGHAVTLSWSRAAECQHSIRTSVNIVSTSVNTSKELASWCCLEMCVLTTRPRYKTHKRLASCVRCTFLRRRSTHANGHTAPRSTREARSMSCARPLLLLLCVALCASCSCSRASVHPAPRRAARRLQAAEAAAADEAAMRTAGSGAAALFNVLLRAAGVPGGVANTLVFDKLQSAYLTTARGGSVRRRCLLRCA